MGIMRNYLYNLATDKYRGFIPCVIKIFLFILSLLYGLLVRVLIFLYHLKPYRLNCKVISVGNITLGGTGKTSLVELIAKYLKNQGHKVAILSRGYKKPNTPACPAGRQHPCLSGRQATPLPVRQAGNTQYETMGDEPYMLSKNLGDIPVIVDTDRIRAARRAIKDYFVDTVILDDGLQQWRIKKDLEVVTIDATNPFGNGHLLPRGILREPLSSFKRASLFVLTKTNLNPDVGDIKDFLGTINPTAPIFESIHKPLGFYKIDKPNELLNIETLKAKTATLISGIADPDSFENLIRISGIKIGLSFKFPDHHHYLQKDLEEIIKESQKKNIDTVVTTQKDAVRLSLLAVARLPLPVIVLRIELKITKDEERFYNRLFRVYQY